jgi:hypothetical protein
MYTVQDYTREQILWKPKAAFFRHPARIKAHRVAVCSVAFCSAGIPRGGKAI